MNLFYVIFSFKHSIVNMSKFSLTVDLTLPHLQKLYDAPSDHHKTFRLDDVTHLPQHFQKALSQINHMISMDYIHVSHDGKMIFTSAGVDNMKRNHAEVVASLTMDGDYGSYSSLAHSLFRSSASMFVQTTSPTACPEDIPYGSIDPDGPKDHSAIPKPAPGAIQE